MLLQQDHLHGVPPSVNASVITQWNHVEVDASGYHALIAAVVILSTITGCFLVFAILRCFIQRTSSASSTVVDVEKSPRRVLILPTRHSIIAPNRTSWKTASSSNQRSSEEDGREEPGSPHPQNSRAYFERHRTSREVVLLPPPLAVVHSRPVSIEIFPVHTEQLEEKIPVVVPPVNLERSSSTIRFSRMDHPNWTPAGDVPPPIPVQVACEREMAARAIYEADHPELKRTYTHGRCGVLGPLAKKITSRRERAMSIPDAPSPKAA